MRTAMGGATARRRRNICNNALRTPSVVFNKRHPGFGANDESNYSSPSNVISHSAWRLARGHPRT